MFKKIYFIFLFLFIFSNSFANNSIKDVENYLNNTKYLKANFLQDDKANAQLTEGVLYISRPGKLRLDYLNPFEASLYTNKSLTIYYDKELDEITNIPTSKTPLHFLLKENISFKDKDIKLLDFKENENEITVYLQETNKEDQGTLIIKLQKKPIELKSISLINELNQEVEIMLFNIDKNKIKNSIFNFKNPRLKNKI